MAKERSADDGQNERRILKEDVAARHRGHGAAVQVLARVVKQHPGDPKRQLTAFLRDFVINAGTGRKRPISAETSTKYADTLINAIEELKKERAPIQNLTELGKTHAVKLISAWVKAGQSASTVQNKTSILRRFYNFIGKGALIPRGDKLKEWHEEHGINTLRRSMVARTSKAWDQNDIDVLEVIRKVSEFCPVTGMQLEMQLAFGLRVNETLQIDPVHSDRGDFIYVANGTKGGLPRDVRFDRSDSTSLWQRDVLERAKVIAAQNRRRTLSIQGKTLAQSKDHFYYVMRKFGINRKGLGVTAHGLRHQFAARRYQEVTGFGAPVTANAPKISAAVLMADHEGRMVVSRDLGHFRADITQAYTGSFRMQSREENQRVEGYVQLTERNPLFWQAMEPFSIERAWLAGKFASGETVIQSDKMRLILAPVTGTKLDAEQRFLLRNALNEVIERGVDLTMHYDVDSPDDCVELFSPKDKK